MKRLINEMKIRLCAISENESVARATVSAFASTLDPTVEELGDLRLALSEAVTNVIVHAYPRSFSPAGHGYIYISVRLYEPSEITVEVSDNGVGIPDVEKAKEPLFTTGAQGERCGMGFLVMESFTDEVTVRSKVGKGTTVRMRKIFHP